MSGTYRLDGELFITNPLRKRWTREQLATSGTGEPLFSAYHTLELEFGELTSDEAGWFFSRWSAGGLHTAVLPHPHTRELVGFTGVAFSEWSDDILDVDSDDWAAGARMRLTHIDLSATGVV